MPERAFPLMGLTVEGEAGVGQGKGIENRQTTSVLQSNTCYSTRLLSLVKSWDRKTKRMNIALKILTLRG